MFALLFLFVSVDHNRMSPHPPYDPHDDRDGSGDPSCQKEPDQCLSPPISPSFANFSWISVMVFRPTTAYFLTQALQWLLILGLFFLEQVPFATIL